MSCHCSKDCECHQNSSFIFGLVFGLIIGAVVAIIIYRRNRQQILNFFKKYFSEFFGETKSSPKTSPPSSKKEVVIPQKLIASTSIPPVKKSSPQKLFKKAKGR